MDNNGHCATEFGVRIVPSIASRENKHARQKTV